MGFALKNENEQATYQPPMLPFAKRRLGRSNLMVSPICFGSLRLTPEDGIYKETLSQALMSGVHFIDTSGTYGNGASEMVIGESLREYAHDWPEQAKSIVLCTKLGLVQGYHLHEVRQGAKGRLNELGYFQISDRAHYCLTPEYLESQLTLSLRRLQVDKVNLVLIQNPEHLLRATKSKAQFLSHLKRAFEHLEVEVARGRIEHYGISSSSFLKKEIASDYLSLSELIELAESISKKHHFSVVQIPFNLFETTPLYQQNQDKMSFFEAAKKYDIGVLTCRPLTSHHRDKVHHFITFPGKDEVSVKGDLHKTMMEVIELEKELLQKSPQHKKLNWGHTLRHHLHTISDWWKWSVYLQKQVLPSLQINLESLPQTIEWNQWKVKYVNSLHRLFSLITDSLQGIANLRTNQISHYLNQECESLRDESKLSNKVTRLYLSLPEIDSIVMGLSHPQHVQDLVDMGKIPQESEARQILERIKMHF
jgi:aryl-alcohol dehydrogenase-like predicted oxidoreductase